jgi:hypothetical protein
VDRKCVVGSESPPGVRVGEREVLEPSGRPVGGIDRKIVGVVGVDGLKSSLEGLGWLACMRGWDGGRL